MQWTIPVGFLVAGSANGFLVGNAGKKPEKAPVKSENVATQPVSGGMSGVSAQDPVILDRVLTGSSFSKMTIQVAQSAEDWISLLRHQSFDGMDMMNMQKTMMDIGLLLRMVPPEQLPSVIDEVERMSNTGGIQSRMMW